MMTGNNFSQMTIMAMGITPYINASIIMQLANHRHSGAGADAEKRRRWQEKDRADYPLCHGRTCCFPGHRLVSSLGYVKAGWYNYVLVGISMAGGTALAMWIGERITEKGIGNGISLLIAAGIVNNLFNGYVQLGGEALAATSLTPWMTLFAVLAVSLVMIVLITWADLGVRRINVHFAKRVSGRKMYGGQNQVIPLKLISVGVLPLIFAYSFMAFPGTIIQLVGGSQSGVAHSGGHKICIHPLSGIRV